MVTYILALAFLHVADAAPRLLEPHTSRDACMVAAEQHNKADDGLRTEQGKKLGAEFVCLKIERAWAA